FSADPDQKYAYVVDGMNEKVWILLRDSLETIGSFGTGGNGGGQFRAAHSIATDSRGNIYVSETWESKRVQRFLYKGLTATRSSCSTLHRPPLRVDLGLHSADGSSGPRRGSLPTRDDEHNFSDVLARLHEPVGVRSLLQWERPIDHRLHPALFEQ